MYFVRAYRARSLSHMGLPAWDGMLTAQSMPRWCPQAAPEHAWAIMRTSLIEASQDCSPHLHTLSMATVQHNSAAPTPLHHCGCCGDAGTTAVLGLDGMGREHTPCGNPAGRGQASGLRKALIDGQTAPLVIASCWQELSFRTPRRSCRHTSRSFWALPSADTVSLARPSCGGGAAGTVDPFCHEIR